MVRQGVISRQQASGGCNPPLLRLAIFENDGKPAAVIAKISQESLAEMVGTTRSRVSFFMNKFRKLGFVAYNRGTLYVYSSLLNVLLLD